ncbi:MoaD/ThiS family protein [Burkholderia gladioli]|uniref:ThiS family protein n=1 Tax=Burkholderia gladioli (strain BSR3) TaxID=999541 RepID=F2LT69_BURGS|nr:MoaD/ThiS family protein [Burkholderia gladioli]AEA66015.1 ThiS family protein [Burkholderia gladioli BSR3]MBW5285047.1 MoaD/ThiS family protein [Burkholderia gladioli]
MTVTVHIPTLLHPLTGDRKQVEAQGANLRELIDDLDARHPGLRARLMRDGALHRFVNFYINDQDVRFAGELDAPVRAGDSIVILPAVAGGAPGRPEAA